MILNIIVCLFHSEKSMAIFFAKFLLVTDEKKSEPMDLKFQFFTDDNKRCTIR